MARMSHFYPSANLTLSQEELLNQLRSKNPAMLLRLDSKIVPASVAERLGFEAQHGLPRDLKAPCSPAATYVVSHKTLTKNGIEHLNIFLTVCYLQKAQSYYPTDFQYQFEGGSDKHVKREFIHSPNEYFRCRFPRTPCDQKFADGRWCISCHCSPYVHQLLKPSIPLCAILQDPSVILRMDVECDLQTFSDLSLSALSEYAEEVKLHQRSQEEYRTSLLSFDEETERILTSRAQMKQRIEEKYHQLLVEDVYSGLQQYLAERELRRQREAEEAQYAEKKARLERWLQDQARMEEKIRQAQEELSAYVSSTPSTASPAAAVAASAPKLTKAQKTTQATKAQ